MTPGSANGTTSDRGPAAFELAGSIFVSVKSQLFQGREF